MNYITRHDCAVRVDRGEAAEGVIVTAPTIKLICAWCQRVLRHGVAPASHGICAACQQAVLTTLERGSK